MEDDRLQEVVLLAVARSNLSGATRVSPLTDKFAKRFAVAEFDVNQSLANQGLNCGKMTIGKHMIVVSVEGQITAARHRVMENDLASLLNAPVCLLVEE